MSYPPSPNRSGVDQGDVTIDSVLQPTSPLRTPIRKPTTPTLVTPSPLASSSSLRVPGSSSAGASPIYHPQSPPRSTHAGGILPPAHFFRPSRPNSSNAARPISTASSTGGSVGRSSILPFKSPTSPPGRSSTLPSTFGSRSPGANVGAVRTRDLLPIGERANKQSLSPPKAEEPAPIPSPPSPTKPSTGTGVRSSLERLWRRKSADSRRRDPDLESASVAEGPDAEEEGPFELDDQEPLGNSEAHDTSVETVTQDQRPEAVAIYPPGSELRYPHAYQVPYTPTPPALEDEPRNRFVHMDEAGSRPGTPRRITIDDIGDGDVDGGGVVMEMGRISMSIGRTPSLMGGRTPSLVGTARTNDDEDNTGIIVNDAVRVKATELSPRTPGGGRAAQTNYSFDVDPEQARPTPQALRPLPSSRDVIPQGTPTPSSPGPQARHARFAPSPRRSPKVNINGILPDDATTYSSSAASSQPYVKRSRTSVSSPPYLIPVLSPRTSKPVRNYEIHPSRNRYFFGGHLIAGGDSAVPFLGALTLLLGVAGLWFGTTCVWWWDRGAGGQAVAIVGGYMLLLTLSSMLMTAFRDPGILPRDLDPDPPYAATASVTSENSPAIPLPRDLRVRSGSVRVKYCVTCKTYRPPRSSHCKMCDNCVDGCDHHCQWVNNCVGRRNYTHFITFVVSASLTTLMVLATGIVMIYLQAHDNRWGIRDGLKHAIGSTVAVGLCLVVIWPLLALTGYHVRLLLLNITTIEQVRNQAHKKLTHAQTPPNPFSIGRWYHNVAYLYYRPPGYSWVDFAGYAVHDTRKVNPGFVVRPTSTADDHDPNGRDSEEARWR